MFPDDACVEWRTIVTRRTKIERTEARWLLVSVQNDFLVLPAQQLLLEATARNPAA